jgi:hypothetical protein
MLTFLLSLLSSSGFGSFLGLAGGLLNRWADYKFRAKDQEFEILKMEKEKEFMIAESEHRFKVAVVEAEGKVEEAGYEAMTASYNFAVPTKDDGVIDAISKLVRPLLTILFFVFSVYVFYRINLLIEAKAELTSEELLSLWKSCIEWILFQSGVAIGWWFAMRPGRSPSFGGK